MQCGHRGGELAGELVVEISDTMIRLAALQAWPALPIRPATAAFTVLVTSSLSSTMNGSDPPSSRTTFLRLRPGHLGHGRAGPLAAGHRHAGHPRVGDHVRDLAVGREHVDVGVLRRPASRKICSIARADSGHCGACLRMIVLPAIRFGAANRATW